MDERRMALEAWAREQLQQDRLNVSVASADASFRRYFRARSGDNSWILADAPPEHEDSRRFADVSRRLREAGLSAPRVLAADFDQGFLLLDDLGDQILLDVMNSNNADDWFERVLDVLVQMQLRANAEDLPAYDSALLRRELMLYPQWYLGKHCGVTFSKAEQETWDDACLRLIEIARQQPQVFVHRDFMPRNLMVPPDGESQPGVIDFQDAVLGPVTYDLVSLFRDAFVSWPEERVQAWVEQYRQKAEAAGIQLPDDLKRDFDLMGVQRHIKVIGIFARLAYRDGKEKYLAETPRFFRYLQAVLSAYPEFRNLLDLMLRYERSS